ncbi:FecR family protein [Chondrinema litorale]|uniref:FecR family protein n=1 Tax=Chondrinema litorale TaxID=2994555 RepID=UPI002542B733|nr:FecR family protein [Chondrinema litorale]UZR98424.1 FecR family protein [Chondrinema litorale]
MDQDKENFLKLATRFLSDEAEQEEIDQLNILLEKQEYQEWFVWISKEWKQESKKLSRETFSKERGKKLLAEKLEKLEANSLKNIQTRKAPKHVSINPILKYAAVITLLFISGFVVYNFINQPVKSIAEETTWKEKKTAKGQKLEITISDGTSIVLNAASKVKYPTVFSDTLREVYLEGEAYFKVAHNPQKPFIVHTANIETKVLGTSFNVNAYPEDKSISVSLIEGKVSVGKADNKQKEMLKPMQQFLFEKKNEKVTVMSFDSAATIGWQKNEFVFAGVSLMEVTQKLSRYYDVQFEFENERIKSYEIRANFNDLPLWTVLDVLSSVGNIEYEIISDSKKIEKVILKSK